MSFLKLSKPNNFYLKVGLTSAFLGVSMGSGIVYADTKIEAAVKNYIQEYKLEDYLSYGSLKSNSDESAVLKDVRLLDEDNEVIVFNEVKINKFKEDESQLYLDLDITGVTDKDGTHYLLSDQNEDLFNLKEYGYDSLKDLKLHLVSDYQIADNQHNISLEAKQADAINFNYELDTSDIKSFVDKYKKLDTESDNLEEALNPLLLFNDIGQIKINKMNIKFENKGFLKRLKEAKPEEYEKLVSKDVMDDCVEDYELFMDKKEVEKACAKISDFLTDKQSTIQASVKPDGGIAISDGMMAFMTMQPEAISALLKRLNLKIDN